MNIEKSKPVGSKWLDISQGSFFLRFYVRDEVKVWITVQSRTSIQLSFVSWQDQNTGSALSCPLADSAMYGSIETFCAIEQMNLSNIRFKGGMGKNYCCWKYLHIVTVNHYLKWYKLNDHSIYRIGKNFLHSSFRFHRGNFIMWWIWAFCHVIYMRLRAPRDPSRRFVTW